MPTPSVYLTFSCNLSPQRENRAQNKAYNGDRKYGNMFNDFLKSTAQKGREYSHWIDLTLNSHVEAVISEIYRTKFRFLSKSTFLGSSKISKKVQTGPAAPTPICWVKQKEEGSS